MSHLRILQTSAAAIAILIALSADFAVAQSGPVVPPQADPRSRNGVSAEQLQKLAWIRYLQGRSGGGSGNVRRGVPQFVPMGGQMPFGNTMNQGGATQPQAGGADPDADRDEKTIAEKKADYAAAREEKKRKAKERAEKRKAELAERRAKSGGK